VDFSIFFPSPPYGRGPKGDFSSPQSWGCPLGLIKLSGYGFFIVSVPSSGDVLWDEKLDGV